MRLKGQQTDSFCVLVNLSHPVKLRESQVLMSYRDQALALWLVLRAKPEILFRPVGMMIVCYHGLVLSGLSTGSSSGSDPLGACMRCTCCLCRCW